MPDESAVDASVAGISVTDTSAPNSSAGVSTTSSAKAAQQEQSARQMQITDFFRPKSANAGNGGARKRTPASTPAPFARADECPKPATLPSRIMRELHDTIDTFDETASFSTDPMQERATQAQDETSVGHNPADYSGLADKSFIAHDTVAPAPTPRPLRTIRSEGNPLNVLIRPIKNTRSATPTNEQTVDFKESLSPGVPVRFDFSVKSTTQAPRNMEEARAMAKSSGMAPPVMLTPRSRFKPLGEETDVFSQDFAAATPKKRVVTHAQPPTMTGERANLSATFHALRSVKSFTTWRKTDVSPECLKRAISNIRERSPLQREQHDDTDVDDDRSRRMSDDSIRPSESMSVRGMGISQEGQHGASANVPPGPRHPNWSMHYEVAQRQRLQAGGYHETSGMQRQRVGDDAVLQDAGKGVRKKSSLALLAAQRAELGSRDGGNGEKRDCGIDVSKPRSRAAQRPGLVDWETFIKEEQEPEEETAQAEPAGGHKTKRFFSRMFKKSKKEDGSQPPKREGK